MWSWIYRLAGKNVANKLNLQEGTPVPTKPWYQSKTIWTAILSVVIGAVQPISSAVGHPITIPNWIYEFLAGAGLYSLRTATTPIQ